MKRVISFIALILLFALAACSNESAKDEQKSRSTANVSAEENKKTDESKKVSTPAKKVDLKEYSFEEFKRLTEDEQKDYFKSLMSNLGYTEALGTWILSLINNPSTQIPSSVQTVGDYAKFYVDTVHIQDGYKLDWKLEEEKNIAKSGNTAGGSVTIKDPEMPNQPITIPKDTANKRIDAVKNKPLFEIQPSGQFCVLSVGTGYSFDYVKNMLGEPDRVGVIKGGKNNIYYIPGNTLRDGLDFYRLSIYVKEDVITGVYLKMHNKEKIDRSIEIPKEFSYKFDGEMLTSNYTDKSYEYWYDFHMMFLRNVPGKTDALEILPEKNDYRMNLSIWNDTEWKVFNDQTRTIYKNITLEEANRILRGPKAAGMEK